MWCVTRSGKIYANLYLSLFHKATAPVMIVMTLAGRLNQLENIDVASKRQIHTALEHKDWLLRHSSDPGAVSHASNGVTADLILSLSILSSMVWTSP